MSRRASRAILYTFLIIATSITPMIGTANAHPAILLSLDKPHVTLKGGYSDNVTLTIENNGSSIESYNISLDVSGLSTVWNVTSVNSTVDGVLPTFEEDTTFIVRLDIGAEPSDSGSFVINVSEQDSDIYSHITVYVTVEPSYATSLSFNSINGPLQQMNAGTTANFTIDVSNDGNAPDTILLDVDSEPDLAAFWANWTNNSTSNPIDVPENVLMYGNSYISTNNLDIVLQDMLNLSDEHNSTISKTGGGMTMPQHWTNMNSSGNSWNTTLRDSGHDWDIVVVQDQSQIPGYPRSNQNWIDSKDAGIAIAEAVEDENSEVMLMMTWGRRNGDLSNPVIYSNFTNMQDRLETGYIDYRDNMSTPSRDVWIAPVGLAFENIYYSVLNSGGTPTAPGNSFYDLYTNDGSHPSLSGSYLAACVLFSSITGNSSIGSNDTVGLSANLKLELQQAADATVFNETSHLSYPWENGASGPTAMSQSRVIPPGWNLVFADSEMSGVAANSSVQTSIQVSVPSNAQPGFYGFNLFSASTNGNGSSNYTFVVEVMAENNLSFSFLDQSNDFIPSQSTNTSIQVTNTGNAELDLNWNLSMISGPCDVSLIDASSPNVMPNAAVNVGITVDVDGTSDSSDECVISLDGDALHGDYVFDPEPFDFTIGIDELVGFELVYASGGVIDITPGVDEQYQLRVFNNGSETVEFLLDITDEQVIETILQSSTSISVNSNSVGLWDVSSGVDSGFVGTYFQNFSVTYQGITQNETVEFDVQPVAGLYLTGPLDGRISTKPGESVDVNIDVFNDGTMDLNLTASVSGLPTGAEVDFSSTELNLTATSSTTIVMSVSMISTAQSGSYPIVVTYSSNDVSASLNLELQVADSVSLTVNSITNNVASGPISDVSYTFEITNLGSASDTFFVSLAFDDSNNASNWFDTILSTSSVNLDSSLTQAVSISIRERSAGAPVSGCDVSVVVKSSNDDTVSYSIGFKIIPIQASAQLTILADDTSVKPGESLSGDVVVTNTGTGEDQFLLTTVGGDCGLSEIFTLAAGSSSQAFEWSCPIDSNASAGLSSSTFRVTSNARSNYVLEEAEIFTVEPNWNSDSIVGVSFGDSELSMASSGGSSTTITITNLANAPVIGSLVILGLDESLFDITMTPLNSEVVSNDFSLSNGEAAVFELLINSRVTESESATLRVSVTTEIDGTTHYSESSDLEVTIEGPELAPTGIDLPFDVQFDQNKTISIMAGGWVFSILLLLLMNMLRKRRKKSSSVKVTSHEEDEGPDAPANRTRKKKEKEVKVHKLKLNECRMTPDNKVTCPFCESKLGVPRGSTPPFKFTCPKCGDKIRVVESQKF